MKRRTGFNTHVFCCCGHSSVFWRDLVEEVDVGDAVLDVALEVADLSSTAGAVQVEVDPADEDLFWGELHELL